MLADADIRQQIIRRKEHSRKGGGRKRRGWFLILVGMAGLLLLALWLLRTLVPESFAPSKPVSVDVGQVPLGALRVYFASPTGDDLVEETRLLPCTGALETDARKAIDALLAGPICEGASPWPADVTVLDFFISSSGIVYVNFGGSLKWLLPEGDYLEWSIMASLTRTLCTAFPEIKGVRVLIDGESSGLLRRVMPLDWTYRPAMFGGTW